MNIKLLTEHHLKFLKFKEGCTGLSESIHVKMPHCWKSHVAAQLYIIVVIVCLFLDVVDAFGLLVNVLLGWAAILTFCQLIP